MNNSSRNLRRAALQSLRNARRLRRNAASARNAWMAADYARMADHEVRDALRFLTAAKEARRVAHARCLLGAG